MSRLYLQRSTLAKRAWPIIFIAIAAFYLWGLGAIPLLGPDEPRYAEVAREMLARRDFITPTLGGLTWFEKPPLLYWLMMFAYRALGVNEYAARLGPALCGLLTTVFIYWIGRAAGKFDRSHGTIDDEPRETQTAFARWSALIWLSSIGTIVFSRAATFDIVLTMTITGALAFFIVAALKEGAGRQRLLAGFYFFSGLSLLAKGLIGPVIVFGVIGLYHLIRRELPGRKFFTSLIWGIPLTVAVAATWYGPMIVRHGRVFVDQFIIQQHFARFVSNKYHHPGPFYFYVPVVIGIALPWTVVLLAALLSSRRWNWRGKRGSDRVRTFALAWLIFPLVFFSFSQSKLPAYVLPALPAVALLVGERLACFCRERRGDRALRGTGLLLIIVAMAAFWYTRQHYSVAIQWLFVTAALPVLAGIVALIRPALRAPLFASIALSVLISAGVGLKFVAPAIAKEQSVRDLLTMSAARPYANAPVVQLHGVERTAEFYAANRIAYGADGEPIKLEDAGQVLKSARQSGGVVLCLVPVRFESQVSGLDYAEVQRIGDNGHVALFVVRAP